MKISNLQIPDYELIYNSNPANFVIRTMDEIEKEKSGKDDFPHRHNYYTIVFIEDAIGIHNIDYKSYEITPSVIFFIHPEQVHHIEVKGFPKGYAILFTEEFLNRYGIGCKFIDNIKLFTTCDENPPIKMRPNEFKHIHSILRSIYKEFHLENSFKYDAIGALLKYFLIECNRIVPQKHLERIPQYHDNDLVYQFKKLVEEHFKQEHKVSFYSGKLFVTPKHLNGVIKSSIGVTAKEYIINRIIMESKRIAQFSNNSMKEIAYQLGFTDPAHFSKLFKSSSGQTFTQFQNSIN